MWKKRHFIKDCKEEDYNSSNESEENVIWCCKYCDKEFEDEEKYCKNKNKQTSGNSCFSLSIYL